MRRRTATTAALLGLLGIASWFVLRSLHGADQAVGGAGAAAGSSGVAREALPIWTRPLVSARGELSIRGTIQDERGPVSGAIVVATGIEEGETLSELVCHCDNDCGFKLLACGCSEASTQLVQLVSERRGDAPPVARTTSGGDGSFELRGLTTGRYALWAQANDTVGVRHPVAAGSSDVVVTLGAGQSIQGKVIGEDHRPVPGAVVTGVFVEHSRFFDVLSGADGKFILGPLPPGKFALVAVAPGLLPEHAAASDHQEPHTFTLYRPRSLRGRVERGGKPVAGATVLVAGEHRKRRTKSDRTGGFQASGLHPGEYSLSVSEGLDRAEVSVQVSPGRDPEQVVVSLEPGGEIVGEVKSALTGQPIVGAKVSAYGRGDESRISVTSATDSRGAYRLGPLPPGRVRLNAHAKGFVDSDGPATTIILGRSTRNDLQLAPAATLQGRILDGEGNAISAARVTAATVTERFGASGTSGEHGEFELDGLSAGNYLLTVEHDQFRPLRKQAAVAPSSALALVMRRGAAISGEIRSGRGPGLPGVTVWAMPAGADPRGQGRVEQRRAESGAEGRFRLEGLEPGEYWVRAKLGSNEDPSEGGRYTSAKVLVPDGASEVPIRISFDEGGTISGTVVDQKDAPLAGVSVKASPAGRSVRRLEGAELEAFWRGAGSTTSGSDGRFTLEHLTASSYRLSAAKEGYRPPLEGEQDPSVHIGASDARIVLRTQTVIHGQVLRRDGSPVTSFQLNGQARQDDDGRFTVPISEAGRQALSVWAPDLAGVERTVEAQDGVDVELPPIVLDEGQPFEGRVLDSAGAPVEGALVDVGGGAPPNRPEFSRLTTRRGAVRSGADGSFRLPHVASQPGYIAVQHPHYMPYARPLENLVPVTVTLVSGARVLGVVQDSSGAILQATVLAQGERGHAVSEEQEDGSYVLWGLRPGEYSVEPLGMGRQTGEHTFRPRKVTVPEAGDIRVDFHEVASGVDLLLDVHTADSSNPTGWWVLYPGQVETPTTLAAVRSLSLAGGIGTASNTDRRFQRIPPGKYTLLYFRDEGARVGTFRQSVEVQDGPQTQTVRVVVPQQLPGFESPD